MDFSLFCKMSCKIFSLHAQAFLLCHFLFFQRNPQFPHSYPHIMTNLSYPKFAVQNCKKCMSQLIFRVFSTFYQFHNMHSYFSFMSTFLCGYLCVSSVIYHPCCISKSYPPPLHRLPPLHTGRTATPVGTASDNRSAKNGHPEVLQSRDPFRF